MNLAVTFKLLLARKLSLTKEVYYMVMQCLGVVCGAGAMKGFRIPFQLTSIRIHSQSIQSNNIVHWLHNYSFLLILIWSYGQLPNGLSKADECSLTAVVALRQSSKG
ncbi:hypothetical protein SSX86_004545 [Deinandra increscens subsp. villosa]|uniref:Uncharacterized protein n=1 Tax=Deinandra increscens subsp. villosa TaxID=3103831 RepID=A0AAP0H959_9ASTR